jgi:hypothetical protein
MVTRVPAKPQAPRDDVAGHIGQAPVLRISVRPEPGERLRRRDTELYRQHPRSLIDLRAVQRQVRGLPVQGGPVTIPGVAVLAAEQHHGRRISENKQVTELPAG